MRGIVQLKSDDRSLGAGVGVDIPFQFSFASSSCSGSSVRGSISRSGSGGLTNGLDFVRRRSKIRQIALANSMKTTMRQRVLWPRRRAAISQSSSVY